MRRTSALSRMWGGIHPPIDDAPGRRIGKHVGRNAFHYAETIVPSMGAGVWRRRLLAFGCVLGRLQRRRYARVRRLDLVLDRLWVGMDCPYDLDNSAVIDTQDLLEFLQLWNTECD